MEALKTIAFHDDSYKVKLEYVKRKFLAINDREIGLEGFSTSTLIILSKFIKYAKQTVVKYIVEYTRDAVPKKGLLLFSNLKISFFKSVIMLDGSDTILKGQKFYTLSLNRNIVTSSISQQNLTFESFGPTGTKRYIVVLVERENKFH